MLWWCSGIGVSAFLCVCCFGVFIMRKHGEEPSSCCVFFYLIFGTDRSRDDVQQIVCFLYISLSNFIGTFAETLRGLLISDINT
jgi:hypothetical protein